MHMKMFSLENNIILYIETEKNIFHINTQKNMTKTGIPVIEIKLYFKSPAFIV